MTPAAVATKKKAAKKSRKKRHPGAQVCISIKKGVYEDFEAARDKVGLTRSAAIAEALGPWMKKAKKSKKKAG